MAPTPTPVKSIASKTDRPIPKSALLETQQLIDEIIWEPQTGGVLSFLSLGVNEQGQIEGTYRTSRGLFNFIIDDEKGTFEDQSFETNQSAKPSTEGGLAPTKTDAADDYAPVEEDDELEHGLDHLDRTYREFNQLVNLDVDEQLSIKTNTYFPIIRNTQLLKKPKSRWSDFDIDAADRTISSIKSIQSIRDDSLTETDRTELLRNWGHDPYRADALKLSDLERDGSRVVYKGNKMIPNKPYKKGDRFVVLAVNRGFVQLVSFTDSDVNLSQIQENPFTPSYWANLFFSFEKPDDVMELGDREDAVKRDLPELDEVYAKYRSLVNMSASELESWAQTEASKQASLTRSPIDRNLRLLRKPKAEWNKRDINDANRTISFISRMKGAQQGEVNPVTGWSNRDVSLKNWAYDPRKGRNLLSKIDSDSMAIEVSGDLLSDRTFDEIGAIDVLGTLSKIFEGS